MLCNQTCAVDSGAVQYVQPLKCAKVNFFLMRNNYKIFEEFQSGFRMNQSTEIALLKILNDTRCNLDNHKRTVLVLLEPLIQ